MLPQPDPAIFVKDSSLSIKYSGVQCCYMHKFYNKKNPYKAVFFDFGGTLMDAESDKKAHYHMMKEIKAIYHLPSSAEDLVIFYEKQLFNKDMTLKDDYSNNDTDDHSFKKLYFYYELSFQTLLEHSNIRISSNDFSLFKKIYIENHLKYISLAEGAWDTILLVKERGYHCGVISDIDLDYQQEQFKALSIDRTFHSITTSEEVGYYKPAAPIFEAALKKANCSGREALIVGDSYHRDIVGGKKMGMLTIWVNNYQKQRDKNNVFSDADFTIKELKEIIPILKNVL